MKFLKRYNRTAKSCERSWTRSGALAIALSFGLVFGSVSVARAEDSAYWAEQIFALLESLSMGTYQYIQTYPTFDNGGGTWEQFLGPPLFEDGDIYSGTPLYAMLDTALNDPSAPLFVRLLAIESALQSLSSRTNFVDYSNYLSALEGHLQTMDGQYSRDFYDLASYLSSIETSAADLDNLFSNTFFTRSGSSNVGDPAIEVNDSKTHDLLVSAISALGSLSDMASSIEGLQTSVDGIQFYEMLSLLSSIESYSHSTYDDLHSFLNDVVRRNVREVSDNLPGVQVYDPYSIRQFNLSSNFYSGFVQNLVSGSGTNRAVRVAINGFSSYTNAVLGSYTGQVATISTNPIPERREGLDPEDSQEYTQSLTDSFEDVDSMLDPLRSIGSRIENISIDPDFGDNSANSRFYIIRPENVFWNSFSFMRSRSSDSDGGLYIDFAEGDLRNFCTKCNGFLVELIHWLTPILIFLVMYHEARWTLNFFHHDRDL